MMSDSVSIRAVDSRWARRQFLQLPWRIYQDDPKWVPPLQQNQKELAGFAQHPFYEEAEAQAFLALRHGNVCGRVLAIVNPMHNRRHQDKCGFFGFFECVNQQEVASCLLDAAVDWLRRRGMSVMRGPVNPSMNYECGLLVDGFDSEPTFMTTYNPPYYAELMTQYGLEKSQDMYAYAEKKEFLNVLDRKMNMIAEAAQERFGVRVRTIDRRRMSSEVRTLLSLFNRGTVGSWGFVPLTDREAEHMGAQLGYLLVPQFVRIAEVEGEPVGALIGLLDYNPLIKKIQGRLFPIGFMHLLFGRKSLKRIRILSSNVLPEYQRWGVGLVLVTALETDGLGWGLEYAEFSWVLESNHLSRKTLERSGLKPHKTWRLYDNAIT